MSSIDGGALPQERSMIVARRNERFRFESQPSARLESSHTSRKFIPDSSTLGVTERQVELTKPPAASLDPAPIFIERTECNLPSFLYDGDIPEARGGE